MSKIAGHVSIYLAPGKSCNQLTIMKHHEDHHEKAQGTGSTEKPQPGSDEGKRAFDSFGDATRRAMDEAAGRAKEAAPRVKSAVSEALHDLTYGTTYGAVFLGTLAAELVPRNLRESMVKGARAGREKARDAMKSGPAKKEGGEVTIDIEPDPSGA